MTMSKQSRIILFTVMLVAAGGMIIFFNTPESDASIQSTDDAYVQADFTTVAPQVAGTVEKVFIEENQLVKAGDMLAKIDDRDFVIAVDAAKAQVGSAEASVRSLNSQLVLQESLIQKAYAELAADDAALKFAQAEQKRYQQLASNGSGTVKAMQQAEAQLGIQIATREKNLAGIKAAEQQIDIISADLEKLRAELVRAQTAQSTAELKLSYTDIKAPIGGTIGQKSIRVGAYVNPGQPLLSVVPLDAVYIDANFRETQLARVHIGQTVKIRIDALPKEVLTGRVASMGPASGVSYSPIAPHNASGNFTKIVQRLPVRISIDPGQAAASRLRVGMSVQPMIDVVNLAP
ncbi:membrane fusion protein (multidrug efflux system) [Phyllobacterium ifriqiyense]